MAVTFPGPYCSQYGISSNDLLVSSRQPTGQHLSRVLKVPKGLVLELFRHKNVKKLPWSHMATWLSSLYGKPIEQKDIQVDLRKLRAHEHALSKNKQKEKLVKFRQECFHIPPLAPGIAAESDEKQKELEKKTCKLKKKDLKIKNLKRQVQRRDQKAATTDAELKDSKTTISQLHRRVANKEEELKKSESKVKRMQKEKVNLQLAYCYYI